MFLIYFLFPILWLVLADGVTFRKNGLKNTLKSLGLWCRLLGCELFTLAMLMLLFMDFGAFLKFSPMGILVAAISSLFFVLLLHGISFLKKKNSWWVALTLFVLVALFLEGTVFNFRTYQTCAYQSIDVTEDCYISKAFVETDKENVYSVVSGGTPYLEIQDLDEKIHNIYVDIIAKNAKGQIVNAYVDTYITDESNENYFKLPSQTVMAEVPSTKYLHVLTNGETNDLKLAISTNYAQTYQIRGIYVNMPQPMHFSILRLAGVSLLLFLFWLLRPSGKAFSYVFSNSLRQKVVTVAVIALQIVMLLVLTVWNPSFSGNPARHTAQYQELAESFLGGQLHLEEEPPEFLAQMDNPYDKTERSEMVNKHKESFYWDAAYFEGKYYVYFGVLPVLLLYLPYRAITGTALPNVCAIQFFLCFFVLGAFLLIGEIIKKYFSSRKIPYLSYLILSLIFVNCSGAVFIAKRPDFYSVPIISALTLTVFGLYFWMRAEKENEICPWLAGIGSLCMALVAGCRPQLLLCSVLIFAIYWNAVFKNRTLFSKKGWKATVSLILPYLMVAAGIMWYNAARFGSPFDFGANYNLTTNDMTGRGYRVERVGLSLFTYFFQLPNITAVFPFLQSSTISTNYLGTTITEPMFGGILIVIPLLWIFALLPSQWKGIKTRGLLAFVLTPLLLSLAIGAFDAQGAGLLQRYVSDFAFLACLSAILETCYLYETTKEEGKLRLHSFMRFSLYVGGAYCFLIIFAKYSVELFYTNPYLFNTVAELVQFW